MHSRLPGDSSVPPPAERVANKGTETQQLNSEVDLQMVDLKLTSGTNRTENPGRRIVLSRRSVRIALHEGGHLMLLKTCLSALLAFCVVCQSDSGR
jgi:hypothetical protein